MHLVETQPAKGNRWGWIVLCFLFVAAMGLAMTETAAVPVGTPVLQYTGTIATDTVSLLSKIASFTYPCVLQIQFTGTVFYSIATTTAATVQRGQRMSAFDSLSISPSAVGYNLGFLASTTAASYSILVHPLVP